jgi:hypothetical protein
LTEANAGSYAPIIEKSGRTPATFVATAAKFARMFANAEAMFVNITRTGAKALPGLSCEQIDRRSDWTAGTFVATATIFAQTFAIDVVMFATCAGMGGTHAATKASTWHRGSSTTVREGAESAAFKRSA